MTEENQKKLYEHFVKTGQTKNAEMILKAYPQFKEIPKEDKKEKSKKSN